MVWHLVLSSRHGRFVQSFDILNKNRCRTERIFYHCEYLKSKKNVVAAIDTDLALFNAFLAALAVGVVSFGT